MGATPGRSVSEQLDIRFATVKHFGDPDITLRQDRTNKDQYLIRKLVLLRESDYQRQLQSLKQKKQLDNPHVCRLVEYPTFVEDMICSRHHTIYAIYEYPHRNLDQEISERFIQKRKFQEKELWSILASCILGLSALQKAEIPHQCLRSQEILLSNSGTIQVADPFSSDTVTNYRKMLESRSARCVYLAPELCELLAKQELAIPEDINPYKADVFTMGMIVLEMGLLEYQYECYKDDFTKINQTKLNQRIEELGNLYSNDLKVMVDLMLQISPQDRQLWSEMQLFVRKNQPTFVESQLVQGESDKNFNTASQNTIVQRPDKTKHIVSNEVEENPGDTLIPVRSSQPTKPRLFGGPADNYVTRVQPDQNLVELSEQETNSEAEANEGIAPLKHHEQIIQPGQVPGKQGRTGKTGQKSAEGSPKQNSGIHQLKPDPNKIANLPAEPVSHTQQSSSSFIKPGNIKSSDNTREPVHLQPRSIKPVQTSATNPSLNSTPHQIPEARPTDLPLTSALPATTYTPPLYSTDIYKPVVQSNFVPSSTYSYSPSIPSYNYTSYLPSSTYTSPALYNPPSFLPSTSYSSLTWLPKPPAFSIADNKDLFTDYAKLGIPRTFIPSTSAYESKFVYESTLPPAKSTWQYNNSNYKQSDSKLAPSPIQAMRDKQKDLSNSPVVGQNQTGQVSESDISRKKTKQPIKNESMLPIRKIASTQKIPRKNSSKDKFNEPDDSSHSNPIFVIEHYKQGSRYQGEKVDNLKHGRGKFFYQDGGLYDGEWVRDKMQGKGKLYYQTGKLAYDGQWENDMFEGEGMQFNEYPKVLNGPFDYRNLELIEDYWTKAKGHFKDDFKQGKCIIYLQNGEYFEGNFEADLATGPGVFYTQDGRKVKGIWSQNKLISENK